MELQEREEPRPGCGEVLVEVVRAGVNFADLLSLRGQYAAAPPPPFVPGLEVSGRVDGRPVLALVTSGGYAEKVAADPRLVFDAHGLDLEQSGGALLVTLTAYCALAEVARLRAGETVLVPAGAGGLGTAAIQMARALGAGRVVAIASTEEKRRFAREQGAHEAIGYEDRIPPVDVVIDGVGGETFQRALESVRPLGRMVLVGLSSGRAPEIPSFDALRRRNVGILGFSLGIFRRHDPDRVAQTVQPALELLRQGRVRPVRPRTFPLGEAAEALRQLANRQTVGKLQVAP
jgi:NADPH2:quinone reductase